MIQPFEMKETRPMELHDGVVSTTTDVWNMLTASQDGDSERAKELAQRLFITYLAELSHRRREGRASAS